MIIKKENDMEWFEFELLTEVPKLTHGVFFHSRVEEAKRNISQTLKLERLISGTHIHKTHVHWVQESQPSADEFKECDGFMTAHRQCGLMVNHAECQAAIFYDPVNHVVANVHAGWRGQAKNIYLKTILKMAYAFGTKPADLLVCISPRRGAENIHFKNFREELPEDFWHFQKTPSCFDLWALARHQLESSGILPHHIEIARIDTHKKEEVSTSHGTVVALL